MPVWVHQEKKYRKEGTWPTWQQLILDRRPHFFLKKLSRKCWLHQCVVRLQQNIHKPGNSASTLETPGSTDIPPTGANTFPRLTNSSDQCKESLQCLQIALHEGQFCMKSANRNHMCWLPETSRMPQCSSTVNLDHSSFNVLVELNHKENLKVADQGCSPGHGWWHSGQSSARKIRKKRLDIGSPLSKKPTFQNCSLGLPVIDMVNTLCFLELRWCDQEKACLIGGWRGKACCLLHGWWAGWCCHWIGHRAPPHYFLHLSVDL